MYNDVVTELDAEKRIQKLKDMEIYQLRGHLLRNPARRERG